MLTSRSTKRGASRSGASGGCGGVGGKSMFAWGGGLGGITGRFGTACLRGAGNPLSGGRPPAWATAVVADIAEPVAISPAFAPRAAETHDKHAASTAAQCRKARHRGDP